MTDTTNAANSSPITAGDAGNSLMPCPFCGGEATLRPQGNAYTKSRKITVKCKDCRVELTHAAIHYGFDWLAEKIERDWNRRAAPQPQGGALTDEQIREVAVDYCRFVFPGVYSIREFDCEEDFFNCVRAIVAQSAPSAPQQAGDGLTDEQYQAISCCIADYRCEPEVEPNISILRGLRSLLAAPRQPGEMGAAPAVVRDCSTPECRCDECAIERGDWAPVNDDASAVVTERQKHTIECVNSWLRAVGLPQYSAASALPNEHEAPNVPDEIICAVQRYGDARADNGDSAAAIMEVIRLLRAARQVQPSQDEREAFEAWLLSRTMQSGAPTN